MADDADAEASLDYFFQTCAEHRAQHTSNDSVLDHQEFLDVVKLQIIPILGRCLANPLLVDKALTGIRDLLHGKYHRYTPSLFNFSRIPFFLVKVLHLIMHSNLEGDKETRLVDTALDLLATLLHYRKAAALFKIFFDDTMNILRPLLKQDTRIDKQRLAFVNFLVAQARLATVDHKEVLTPPPITVPNESKPKFRSRLEEVLLRLITQHNELHKVTRREIEMFTGYLINARSLKALATMLDWRDFRRVYVLEPIQVRVIEMLLGLPHYSSAMDDTHAIERLLVHAFTKFDSDFVKMVLDDLSERFAQIPHLDALAGGEHIQNLLEVLPVAREGSAWNSSAAVAHFRHEPDCALCAELVKMVDADPATATNTLAMGVRSHPNASYPPCFALLKRWEALPLKGVESEVMLDATIDADDAGRAFGPSLEALEEFLTSLTHLHNEAQWRCFLKALHCVVWRDDAPLKARYRVLRKYVSVDSRGTTMPAFVSMAAWIAISKLIKHSVLLPPESTRAEQPAGTSTVEPPTSPAKEDVCYVYHDCLHCVNQILQQGLTMASAPSATDDCNAPNAKRSKTNERNPAHTVTLGLTCALPYILSLCFQVSDLYDDSEECPEWKLDAPYFTLANATKSWCVPTCDSRSSPLPDSSEVTCLRWCPFCGATTSSIPRTASVSSSFSLPARAQPAWFSQKCAVCSRTRLNIDGTIEYLPLLWHSKRTHAARDTRLFDIYSKLILALAPGVPAAHVNSPSSHIQDGQLQWMLQLGLLGVFTTLSLKAIEANTRALCDMCRILLALRPGPLLCVLETPSVVRALNASGLQHPLLWLLDMMELVGDIDMRWRQMLLNTTGGSMTDDIPTVLTGTLAESADGKPKIVPFYILRIVAMSYWPLERDARSAEVCALLGGVLHYSEIDDPEDKMEMDETACSAFRGPAPGEPLIIPDSAENEPLPPALVRPVPSWSTAEDRPQGFRRKDGWTGQFGDQCLHQLLYLAMCLNTTISHVVEDTDAIARLCELYGGRNFLVPLVARLVFGKPFVKILKNERSCAIVLPPLVIRQRRRALVDIMHLVGETNICLFVDRYLPLVLYAMLSTSSRVRIAEVDGLLFLLHHIYKNGIDLKTMVDECWASIVALILWRCCTRDSSLNNCKKLAEEVHSGILDVANPRSNIGGGTRARASDLTANKELELLDLFKAALAGDGSVPVTEILFPRTAPGGQVDRNLILRCVALLLLFMKENIITFAPKIVDFLHHAGPEPLPALVECWSVFTSEMPVAKLTTWLSTVSHELARLGKRNCPLAYLILNECVMRVADLTFLSLLPTDVKELAPALAKQQEFVNKESASLETVVRNALRIVDSAQHQGVFSHQQQVLPVLERLIRVMESHFDSSSALFQGRPKLLKCLVQNLIRLLIDAGGGISSVEQRRHAMLVLARVLGLLGAMQQGRLDGLNWPKQQRVGSQPSTRASASFQSQTQLTLQSTGNSPNGEAIDLAKTVILTFFLPKVNQVQCNNFYGYGIQLITQSQEALESFNFSNEEFKTVDPYFRSSYELFGEYKQTTDTFESLMAVLLQHLSKADITLDPLIKTVFLACAYVVTDNNALALYLVPYVFRLLLNKDVEGTAKRQDKANGQGFLATVVAPALRALLQPTRSVSDHVSCFHVYDLLHRWKRKQRQQLTQMCSERNYNPEMHSVVKSQVTTLSMLIEAIDARAMVEAALRAGAPARALRELERAMESSLVRCKAPSISRTDCKTLQSIYEELEDDDAAVGVVRCCDDPDTETLALHFERTKRWADALYSYTLLDDKDKMAQQLLQCGHPEISLCFAEAHQCYEQVAKVGWRLAEWDRLDFGLSEAAKREIAAVTGSHPLGMHTPSGQPEVSTIFRDFEAKLALPMLAFHKQDDSLLQATLDQGRLKAVEGIRHAVLEQNERKIFPHLLQLHVLTDLEMFHRRRTHATDAIPQDSNVPLDVSVLRRLELNVESFSDRRLVLDASIAALRDMGRLNEAWSLTLQCHRENRKVLQAQCPPMTIPTDHHIDGVTIDARRWNIECAKHLKTRGYDRDALILLQKTNEPNARLLWARWASSAELLTPQSALAEFKHLATKLLPTSEKAWFSYADYCDSLLKTAQAAQMRALQRITSSDKDDLLKTAQAAKLRTLQRRTSSELLDAAADRAVINCGELVLLTLQAYLKCAAICSRDRAILVLNRVLQICGDFCNSKVVALLEKEWNRIASWKWYLVLPQLLIRIQHPGLRVGVLQQITASLGRKYCLHCSWYFLALYRSANSDSSMIGRHLVEASCSTGDAQRDSQNRSIYQEVIWLATRFQNVAELMQNVASANHAAPLFLLSTQKSAVLLELVRWRGTSGNVMMPSLRQFSVETLPRDDSTNETPYSHTELAKLLQFKDEVEVLKSKVKPKKVILVSNTGDALPFLLKSEKRGDLRKDSRLMEVATMLNHLLKKDPESRRRNLELSTYCVMPLKDTVGLIEWVPNTRAMKLVIEDERKVIGSNLDVIKIREKYDKVAHNPKAKYNLFVDTVVPGMPPMLHKWFQSCADPAEWYQRRQTYCKSLAAWSIFGFFVGLGDRHTENILVDTKSARLVHVDFDCLLGRGLELEIPELVPFRLTQNCVMPLGPTGIEGAFRSCCEITCRVLRANRGTLLSVLHSFVGDPLVDVQKDQQQQYAQKVMVELEKKFNGMVNFGAALKGTEKSPPAIDAQIRKILSDVREGEKGSKAAMQGAGYDRGAGLSVEGQVDELIKAAMCQWNLAQMYIGWMSWL